MKLLTVAALVLLAACTHHGDPPRDRLRQAAADQCAVQFPNDDDFSRMGRTMCINLLNRIDACMLDTPDASDCVTTRTI